MNLHMLIAGFGGQGILFLGKVVAYSGLLSNKEVSWLPSYGPEMRGGTAHCSVCIDSKPISCPIVSQPRIFLALNAPSFQKFVPQVQPGGKIVYDNSLIQSDCDREDVSYHAIPVTALAAEHKLDGLSNLIMLGHTLRHLPFTPYQTLCDGAAKCISPSKAHLLKANLEALALGYGYDTSETMSK